MILGRVAARQVGGPADGLAREAGATTRDNGVPSACAKMRVNRVIGEAWGAAGFRRVVRAGLGARLNAPELRKPPRASR